MLFTLSGTVDTFDATSFQQLLGAHLDVPASAITLSVRAASIVVSASIATVGLTEGERIASRLHAYNATELSASLGAALIVEDVSSPSLQLLGSSAPLVVGSHGLSDSATIAIVVSAAVALLLLLGGPCHRLRARPCTAAAGPVSSRTADIAPANGSVEKQFLEQPPQQHGEQHEHSPQHQHLRHSQLQQAQCRVLHADCSMPPRTTQLRWLVRATFDSESQQDRDFKDLPLVCVRRIEAVSSTASTRAVPSIEPQHWGGHCF